MAHYITFDDVDNEPKDGDRLPLIMSSTMKKTPQKFLAYSKKECSTSTLIRCRAVTDPAHNEFEWVSFPANLNSARIEKVLCALGFKDHKFTLYKSGNRVDEENKIVFPRYSVGPGWYTLEATPSNADSAPQRCRPNPDDSD